MSVWFEDTKQKFARWPDTVLFVALLAAAAVIVYIALLPGHQLLKATVLAYVLLP